MAVENVVTEDERGIRIADELFPYQKSLGNPARFRLNSIGEPYTPLVSVSEESAEEIAVAGGGYHLNFPDSRQHQD